MTQQEFESRTGMTVTAEEYAKIESLYMSAGNIDKDTFCKEYKKVANSQMVQELQLNIRITENKVKNLQIELDAAKNRENDMANFLMEQAQKLGISDLREKAIELIGIKEYLRRKLASGTPLWDADREALKEILDNII